MNVRATFLVATAACLSLAATGCVTEPLDGDSIADRHHDNFDFFGFAYEPYQYVEIQAWNYDKKQWEYVAHTWASDFVIDWNGIELYWWSADSIHIPHELSDHYWEHISDPTFRHRCEVRVVNNPGGYGMATFDQNYPGLLSAYSMTLADLVNQAGNGSTLTVYSEN